MLRQSQIETVHRIWDQLAEFKAAESDSALEFLIKEIARLAHADDGMWVGTVRMRKGAGARHDRQHGWRIRAVRLLKATSEVQQALMASADREQDTPEAAMTTIAVAYSAGRVRAVRMRQLVNMSLFRRTKHFRTHYQDVGIEDRMWISFPVNEYAESHFVFDRMKPHRRFSVNDLELAAYALRGLLWFHRQTLLSYGLIIAKVPLSPTQRRVLSLLLTDCTEKMIAEKLHQSVHTTHTHVRDILRRYGVNGRAGLMSAWLNG